jgi:hypothetical protein
MHLAVAENQVKTIELLQFHNARMKNDHRGETPFNDAIRAENTLIIALLKAKYGKADVSFINT